MRFVGVFMVWSLIFCGQVCGAQKDQQVDSVLVDNGPEKTQTGPGSEPPIHELVGVATLSYNSLHQVHSAKVEIPSLEAGKRYRLVLQLINPDDHGISFDRVELQCSCMKLKVKDKVVPANGGVGELEFLIDAPTRAKKSSVVYMARFVQKGATSPVMILNLHFELNNMFSVLEDHVQLNFLPGQTELEVKVPVVLVAPVNLGQLELVASEKVRDLGMELVENEDGAFVRVIVNRKNLIDNSLSGEIAVRRRGTEDTDGFLLTSRVSSSIEVSPASIRLARDVTAPDSEFVGSAVVRVAGLATDQEESRTPEVELWVNGKMAIVEMKRLGQSNVYRLRVRVAELEKPQRDGSVEIKWVLSDGKETREVHSNAYFSE